MDLGDHPILVYNKRPRLLACGEELDEIGQRHLGDCSRHRTGAAVHGRSTKILISGPATRGGVLGCYPGGILAGVDNFHDGGANENAITLGDNRLGDLLSVYEGAVCAASILEMNLVAIYLQDGMAPGNHILHQDDIEFRTPPDNSLLAVLEDELPPRVLPRYKSQCQLGHRLRRSSDRFSHVTATDL